MSVPPNALRALVSKRGNSAVMRARRLDVLRHAGPLASQLARSLDQPVITIAANEVFMRFVPHDSTFLKNYNDIFRLPPNVVGVGDSNGLGGFSKANRFTGVIGDATLGLNGSYWGKADGVAGEDFYYSMWKHFDGEGPPRLMAKYGHVMVQRAAGALNQFEDRDVPQQLLFSGNTATNIIVARTIRPIRCLNMDLSDPAVVAHMKKIQPLFQQLLTGLEFSSIEEAIEDSEFREFARQFVHGACLKMGVEGIWARTVRHEQGKLLNGFNQDKAQNLILLGDGNGTLTDRLVGCGVIKIRSGPGGLSVTADPIMGKNSPYDDGEIRALTVIRH